MNLLSVTEENYLKAIYQLTIGNNLVGTNELAQYLEIKPATVTDMLKKLNEKELVTYVKYGKTELTENGKMVATSIIRKHRLWETFLFDKLGFSWDEVHEVAEQLEHIKSNKLIDNLDKFLNYPKFDPHGEAIPNQFGVSIERKTQVLANEKIGHNCYVVGVKEDSSEFLKHIDKLGININKSIVINDIFEYDGSLSIEIDKIKYNLSHQIANKILVSCNICEK